MHYFLYIVECADRTLYTGITTDITRRIAEHNSGEKGAKYTRNRRPVRVVYLQEFLDRSSASKEEYRIKKLSRKEKKRLISSYEQKLSNLEG